MRLILIRHGQSIGNTKHGFISGRNDPEGLTEKGKMQVIRTAWELRKEKIDAIYLSPVVRARQTAQIIKIYFDALLYTEPHFNELHHGIFEGHYWWEVIDQVPPSWRAKREDFETAYPGGGESMKALVNRVWQGVKKILENQKDADTAVIISHQAVISAIRYCLLYGDPKQIDNPTNVKRFLNYIHTKQIQNAAYVCI